MARILFSLTQNDIHARRMVCKATAASLYGDVSRFDPAPDYALAYSTLHARSHQLRQLQTWFGFFNVLTIDEEIGMLLELDDEVIVADEAFA